MSFASDIKQDILNNYSKNEKKCCINAEKFGEMITEVNAKSEINSEFVEYFEIEKLNECCMKSIIQGAFLSSGYIANPQTDYNFEIIAKSRACIEYLFNLFSLLEFTPKIIKKKNTSAYSLYIKDSEQISIILSILGSTTALLLFEQIRVEKDVKNNVNRTTNCETANLTKTINSAYTQLQAIKKLKSLGKYEKIDPKLKYVASLREKYKDESLEFIANKTLGNNKLSKSGLKHRLDKLIKLANEI